MEIKDDIKSWYAISCPTTGVRFDARTLELMDTDHDGFIRSPEVLSALAFLASKGVSVESLKTPDESLRDELQKVLARQADLAREKPSSADQEALAAWEAKGKLPEVAVLGDDTAAAEAALGAVEKVVDTFFTPPDDMPLVTEEADRDLPLHDHLNPKHLEAVLNFAAKCVTPLLGDRDALSRLDYKAVKAKLAAYREWLAARPMMNADRSGKLVEEERLLRYRLFLGEFLENYVTMDRLYGENGMAMFQMGILRIDGREMSLCFHVDGEAAHAALAEKSQCCVIYLKLTRKGEATERNLCAVVTAGTIGSLYVGRNGVFYDRDGKDWGAVVTRVIESQVSLSEAFWLPWRKIGDGIGATVKKFLGDKQAAALAGVQKGLGSAHAGGAALASSVAAIGIGVGMCGAAFASIMAVLSRMTPLEILLSLVAVVMTVSLPSVILTWFRLRKRDLGAILNASGWAVNREIRFSMKRAAGFTKCAKDPFVWIWAVFAVVIACGLVACICLGRSGIGCPAPAARAIQPAAR